MTVPDLIFVTNSMAVADVLFVCDSLPVARRTLMGLEKRNGRSMKKRNETN
jgi:hypothetical protein